MRVALRVLFLVLVSGLWACGSNTHTPISPSPTPGQASTPSPSATGTVTGVVYESTAAGLRPLPDVDIDISVEYQVWPPTIRSGADGRYTRPDVVFREPLKLIAEKPGYSQPCRVPITPREGDQNVYLVSDQTLSSTGIPSSLLILQPTLTGLVYERMSEGPRPIAGAAVVLDFSGGLGWAPSARTKTDAEGRYLLCELVEPRYALFVGVSKPGYRDVFLRLNASGSFDVELERQ